MKRRAVERFDALAVGGPLDGLILAFERMSDGSFKVLGGQAFGADLALYELDNNERLYRLREAS